MNEVMSIVIPVYNRAVELPRTMASIVAQDYRPLRVILVDNNSTDNSLAVCHNMQQLYQEKQLRIEVVQQMRPGASAARNRGLELVDSRYMMFFDSDDEMHSNTVSRYMQAFASHPDADIIGATINFHNGSKTFLAKAVFSSDPEPHIIHGTLSTQRFAVRTQLIREVGGWQETYNGWEDWNLGLRLLLHTQKIYWLKESPVATVYLHENTLTARTNIDGYRNFYQAVRHTLKDIASIGHTRKHRLMRLVLYRQVLLAAHILREARRQNNDELRQFAQQIYQEAMDDRLTTRAMRCFFPICRLYASHGGRGSGTVAQWIIRQYIEEPDCGCLPSPNEVMSIVIPVYNRAVELPRTMASIAAQDYRPLRVILVDNNSTDNSLAVCHNMQQLYQEKQLRIEVVQQMRPGASAARNRGLELVDSRYMMFFDSDDEMYSDTVSRYMQAFASHPDTDIIGATINFYNGSKTFPAKAVFSSDPEPHIIHGTLSTERFAVRTQLIREVGGWQEAYNGWEDWNLGLRLLLYTQRIYWFKESPVAKVYLHKNTLTARTNLDGYRNFYQAVRHTLKDIASIGHTRKHRLMRLVLYRQVLLAAHIQREAHKQNNDELRQFAQQIYQEAMDDRLTTRAMRCFFPICRLYASHGGRGSGTIAQWIIR